MIYLPEARHAEVKHDEKLENLVRLVGDGHTDHSVSVVRDELVDDVE
jgi:hypothetical protein